MTRFLLAILVVALLAVSTSAMADPSSDRSPATASSGTIKGSDPSAQRGWIATVDGKTVRSGDVYLLVRGNQEVGQVLVERVDDDIAHLVPLGYLTLSPDAGDILVFKRHARSTATNPGTAVGLSGEQSPSSKSPQYAAYRAAAKRTIVKYRVIINLLKDRPPESLIGSFASVYASTQAQKEALDEPFPGCDSYKRMFEAGAYLEVMNAGINDLRQKMNNRDEGHSDTGSYAVEKQVQDLKDTFSRFYDAVNHADIDLDNGD